MLPRSFNQLLDTALEIPSRLQYSTQCRRNGSALEVIAPLLLCLSIIVMGAIGIWHALASTASLDIGDSGACRLAAVASGFTLIEMSLVMIIIGLLIGGIILGRELIEAAKVRSQLSQIEQYRTAVHVFQNKFNSLPGDLTSVEAASLGFAVRDYTSGYLAPTSHPGDGTIGELTWFSIGEHTLFWSDLAKANLIPGTFSGDPNVYGCDDFYGGTPGYVTSDSVTPKAVIGNHVLALSGQASSNLPPGYNVSLINNGLHFTVSPSLCFASALDAWRNASVITPQQAGQMDRKADDGKPLTGAITAQGMGGWGGLTWLWSLDQDFPSQSGSGYDQNVPNDAGNCYNNGNNVNAQMVYGASNTPACVISFSGE